MTKWIIFLDGELKGYLNDESSTKLAVNTLASHIINDFDKTHTRIFQEDVKDGVNIYSQPTDGYIFNFITLRHTISWKQIQEYKIL